MLRRVRVVSISLRGAAISGAWMVGVPGVILGGGAGAMACWLAGAVVGWQRNLAFTLGVASNLLPFGDQLGTLEAAAAYWWLVIPLSALLGGAAGVVLGAFLGLMLAALYDRYPVAKLIWLTIEDGPEPEVPGEVKRLARGIARPIKSVSGRKS